jgi:hypothetical protein
MRLVTLQPTFTLNDFNAVLNSGQYVVAECFTIKPTQGAFQRFTDLQEDVSIVGWNDTNRYTYSARQVVVSGLKAESITGTAASEQEIELGYDAATLFQAWAPWPQALLLGRLDGALISRDWAVAAAWGSPWIGVTRMFSGYVSDLDSVGRTLAKIKVRSDLERLNVQFPRDLFMPRCKNTFGDFRCGVDLNSLAVLGTVGGGATRSQIPWGGASASYALGKIHISNSDSVTRVRTVRKADGSKLYLEYPLDFTPANGLQFTAFPGCNRLLATGGCLTYHAADYQSRFGGYPFVPVAETAF